MIQHPARRRASAQHDHLDPERDWEEIYRRFALWEHPAEVRLGFQLAFYSPLSVPRMAKLLRRTGHFARGPEKRAYDTGIVMYEIIHGGFQSARSQQMIDLMNRLHGRHHSIQQQDMTYVLCGLIVEPIRIVERAGWRAATDAEKQASVRWYAELAQRLHMQTWPASYTEATTWYDQYRAQHVKPSDDSRALAAATMHVLQRRMPSPARPFVRPITAAVIGDRPLVEALGLGPYSPALTAGLNAVLRLRAAAARLTPPPAKLDFEPGQAAGVAYPSGYTLGQIGPDTSLES